MWGCLGIVLERVIRSSGPGPILENGDILDLILGNGDIPDLIPGTEPGQKTVTPLDPGIKNGLLKRGGALIPEREDRDREIDIHDLTLRSGHVPGINDSHVLVPERGRRAEMSGAGVAHMVVLDQGAGQGKGRVSLQERGRDDIDEPIT